MSFEFFQKYFKVMKLPSNGQLNGMMNGNGKKRTVAVNKRVGILKASTSCPNLTAADLNRNACTLTTLFVLGPRQRSAGTFPNVLRDGKIMFQNSSECPERVDEFSD